MWFSKLTRRIDKKVSIVKIYFQAAKSIIELGKK